MLFIFAWLVHLPLSIWNYFLVKNKKGYFRQSALNLDVYGCYEYRTFWNKYLITPYASTKFGILIKGEKIQTISACLGEAILYEQDQMKHFNEIANPQLTRLGNLLVKILTEKHCINSIN